MKTVSAGNIVEFHPVRVVKAQIDGVWVTGPPDAAGLITVGQDFVGEGETVTPRPEEPRRRDAGGRAPS